MRPALKKELQCQYHCTVNQKIIEFWTTVPMKLSPATTCMKRGNQQKAATQDVYVLLDLLKMRRVNVFLSKNVLVIMVARATENKM